jgi:hypothetical protein
LSTTTQQLVLLGSFPYEEKNMETQMIPEMPAEASTHYIQENVGGGVPIKMWTRGVQVEDEARRQLTNVTRLPIVFKHMAVMPDVHFGIGATIGSVIPTIKAIIPAAVGVDIGCGMMAAQSDLVDVVHTLKQVVCVKG